MSGLEITEDFNEPYHGAGISSLPTSFGAAVVALDGRPYLIDTNSQQYRRTNIDVVNQRNVGDQRDILLLPQDVWRQSQSGWHYGAGQSNLDRDDANQYRFNSSYGMNPWERWEISLLNKVERLKDLTGQSASAFMAVLDPYLVVSASAGLLWYSSLSASATPTHQNLTYNPIDLASDGSAVYALLYNGAVEKCTNPTTHSTFLSLTSPDFIAYAKDYLIANQTHTLYDISTGVTKKIYEHPNAAFRWIDACEGSQFIYVLGGVGDRWNVHKIGIKTDGTGLLPGIVAVTLPDGEIAKSIGSYLGYIFIGTNKGVRMAQADANGDLTLGAIIPTTSSVYCFEGQDRFVWYGINDMEAQYSTVTSDNTGFPSGNVSGLGRMDLSTFTTTSLTPAWATDIAAADWSKGNVQSVVTWNDKRVFAINGIGVFYEGTQKVPGGWLKQGIMSFSVEDLKNALYMQAKWHRGYGKIGIDMSFDTAGYSRYATLTLNGTNIRSGNVSLKDVQFSRAEPRYVFYRSSTDLTQGPKMSRWELRATPVRGSASRWTVPIVNHEELTINEVTYQRNVLDELNTLMDLVQSGRVFVYQESGQSYTVHVRAFEWVAEKLSVLGNGWQGTFVVVIDEVV